MYITSQARDVNSGMKKIDVHAWNAFKNKIYIKEFFILFSLTNFKDFTSAFLVNCFLNGERWVPLRWCHVKWKNLITQTMVSAKTVNNNLTVNCFSMKLSMLLDKFSIMTPRPAYYKGFC